MTSWALRDGAAHRFWHAPAVVRPPGGESFADVMVRVAAAVQRISPGAAGRDLVVVAHGGSIRAALAHALGIEAERALGFAVDNCSLTRLITSRPTMPGAWGRQSPGTGPHPAG
jgi:alpha-ribazole phosphatase